MLLFLGQKYKLYLEVWYALEPSLDFFNKKTDSDKNVVMICDLLWSNRNVKIWYCDKEVKQAGRSYDKAHSAVGNGRGRITGVCVKYNF